MRFFSSRVSSRSRGVALPLGGIGVVIVGLLGGCSSDNGQATDGDAGTTVDSSVGDSGIGIDGAQSDGGIQLDSSNPDTSGGGDSSTTGDAGNADAPYAFDGFAHPDGYSEASYCLDDDNDGFTTCAGDCNDHDSLVNPCAFDTSSATDPVGHDGIDNDCDGTVDNLRVCDQNIAASGHDTIAAHYAWAADICDNVDPRCKTIVDARFYGPNNASAHRVTKHMGTTFVPKKGQYMAFLSTGIADDDTDTPAYRTGDGTDLMNAFTHPSPLPAAQNTNPCGSGQDETPIAIHDYTELRLTLKAPSNAGSFTFDFNFFSEEYPVYVCQGFNDTFLAMLTSQQYAQPFQIAFDPQGHRVNVNNSFFQDCTSVTVGQYGYNHTCTGALSLLNKTGYEIPYAGSGLTNGNGNLGSGATDWLKTTAPIKPGETFTLSFIVFDEHDGILDSAVILDNFRWNSTTLGSPVTGR